MNAAEHIAFEAKAEAPPLTQASAPQSLGLDHYFGTIDKLLSEAWARGELRIFADAATWSLARIIESFNSAEVTGEIISRLGWHVGDRAERRKAAQQLAEVREAGKKVN